MQWFLIWAWTALNYISTHVRCLSNSLRVAIHFTMLKSHVAHSFLSTIILLNTIFNCIFIHWFISSCQAFTFSISLYMLILKVSLYHLEFLFILAFTYWYSVKDLFNHNFLARLKIALYQVFILRRTKRWIVLILLWLNIIS